MEQQYLNAEHRRRVQTQQFFLRLLTYRRVLS